MWRRAAVCPLAACGRCWRFRLSSLAALALVLGAANAFAQDSKPRDDTEGEAPNEPRPIPMPTAPVPSSPVPSPPSQTPGSTPGATAVTDDPSVDEADSAGADTDPDSPASPRAPAAPTSPAVPAELPPGQDAPSTDEGDLDAPDGLPPALSDYDFSATQPCPYCVVPDQEGGGPRGLHWHDHWNRVGPAEYVAIPAFFGMWTVATLIAEPERDGDWQGPILLDQPMRDFFALKDRKLRDRAKTISDILLLSTFIQPTLIDNFLVSILLRDSPDVAWQMFVINTQAYAITLGLNGVTKRLVSRERPWGDRCEQEGADEFGCGGSSQFVAFYSGHAAITATSAGLLCAHHTQLRLYREPALDAASCITGIAMTAVTGALRVASDNHWASDVAVGHLMGYASGYLFPTLFYYKEFRFTPEPDDQHDPAEPSQVIMLPMVGPDSIQLSLFGLF